VFDMVLNEQVVSRGTVEVNSLNNSGLTPLDVLLLEEGDREIEEILRQATARRSEDLRSLAQAVVSQNWVVTPHNSSNQQSRTEQAQSPARQLIDYFKYDKIKESPSKTRNTLLVIVILIATATYQAVLSPPGGVWQDDNNGTTPHTAGKSVMASHNSVAYCLFLVSNSMGFFMSLHMLYFLTAGFPMQLELKVSLLALTVTYDTSMTAMTPNTGMSFLFTILSVVMPILIPLVTIVVRNHLKKPRVGLQCTRQASV
ncbi:unnamed protein product, partial [Ilex paraguariensis]